jgi:hypothetical protein
MKHKSWLKNYEADFERLATEMGDLRYDTLSEFLNLLAQKIALDGEKDAARGRKKLAQNLAATAQSLAESAKFVHRAWQICEPFMFPADITNQIKTKIQDSEKQKIIFQLLAQLYKKHDADTNFDIARNLVSKSKNFESMRENLESDMQKP